MSKPMANTVSGCLLATFLLVSGGCAQLPSVRPEPVQLHLLTLPLPTKPISGPVLYVTEAVPSPGYTTTRMVYTQGTDELLAFSRHEWAEPPAGMLTSLVVQVLDASGRFTPVTNQSGGLRYERRVDLQLLFLKQDFTTSPSRGKVGLKVQIVDPTKRTVVASRVFTASAPAPSDDPKGGVAALRQATLEVGEAIVAFCKEWIPTR